MRKHSRAVNPTGVFWARHLYLEVTSPTTLARLLLRSQAGCKESAPIHPANAASRLALRAQAGCKEKERKRKMNRFWTKYLRPAVVLTLILTIVTGFIYPGVVTALAHLIFNHQANGSLLYNSKGQVIGSELIGQYWTLPEY